MQPEVRYSEAFPQGPDSFSSEAPWFGNAEGMPKAATQAKGVPEAKPNSEFQPEPAASAAARGNDCPQDEEACPPGD